MRFVHQPTKREGHDLIATKNMSMPAEFVYLTRKLNSIITTIHLNCLACFLLLWLLTWNTSRPLPLKKVSVWNVWHFTTCSLGKLEFRENVEPIKFSVWRECGTNFITILLAGNETVLQAGKLRCYFQSVLSAKANKNLFSDH